MTTRDLMSFDAGAPEEAGGEGPSYRAIECRIALTPSRLPGLDFALNPYLGCGHDCVYCFAPEVLRKDRSRWAIDIGARNQLPRLLAKELRSKRGTIGLGTVTDPYQPLESRLGLTRRCLEELVRAEARVSVLTKSDLVLRDTDLLARLPGAEVGITVTTIDERLAGLFEPGAPSPQRRLGAIACLSQSGLDTYVMIGPILPDVTDRDLDSFMGAIAASGTRRVMTDRLRLRPGLMGLFQERLSPSSSGLDGFMASAGDQRRAASLDAELARRCSALGLRYERAF